MTKAERTAAITRSIASGARAPLASFDSRKYIQHNLNIGDGLSPILEFMDQLTPTVRSEVVRQFEDGDYSVVHADYELGMWGPMVGFEVHRWQDDRIVEHWDNLCVTRSDLNPSGRSMVDGESNLTELDRTDENRALIARFAEEVLLSSRLEVPFCFFRGGALLQHSPEYGDGHEEFQTHFAMLKQKNGLRYEKIHKVLGQGNFFLVMSEGQMNGKQTAFYDLYRTQAGFIAEHWEIFEQIPTRDQWKNDNGKF